MIYRTFSRLLKRIRMKSLHLRSRHMTMVYGNLDASSAAAAQAANSHARLICQWDAARPRPLIYFSRAVSTGIVPADRGRAGSGPLRLGRATLSARLRAFVRHDSPRAPRDRLADPIR